MITFLLLIFLYGQSLLLAMEKKVETKQNSKVFFGSRWIVKTGDRDRTIIIFMGEEVSIIKGKGLNFNEVLRKYLKNNSTQKKLIYCKGTSNLSSINKTESLGGSENPTDIIDPVKLWGKMVAGLYPHLEKLEQSKIPKVLPKDLIQYLNTDGFETKNYNQNHSSNIQSLFEKEVNEMLNKMKQLSLNLVNKNLRSSSLKADPLFFLEQKRNDILAIDVGLINESSENSLINYVIKHYNEQDTDNGEKSKVFLWDLFKVCQDFYFCALFNQVYEKLMENNDAPIIIYSCDFFLFSRLNELLMTLKGGVIQSSELQEVVSNKLITSDQSYLKFDQSKDYLGISKWDIEKKPYKRGLSEPEIKMLLGEETKPKDAIKIEQKRPLLERMKRAMTSFISWRNLGIAAAGAAAIGTSSYLLSRSKSLV